MRELFHEGETVIFHEGEAQSNYWWYPCPLCKTEINKISESGKVGACAKCRDRIIPNHIPLEQHKQYLKEYLNERNYELYNM